MRIVLASDENYIPYIYVSLLTLFQSNINEDYKVTYVYQNVSEEKLKHLKELGEKYNRDVEIRAFVMPREYEVLPAYANSKTTYAKFLFASMFPDDEQVIYLDPDTIILNSLDYILNLDLGMDLIAGVTECLPHYHKAASHMAQSDHYINGGVVICNLKQWRKENFEKKALRRLTNTHLNLNYDQGILNELCSGRIRVLSPKYNVLAEVFEFRSAELLIKRYKFDSYYTQAEIDEAVFKPVIVHFTGFLYGKPLSRYCTHPYSDLFVKKLKECPWGVTLNNDVLNTKQRFRKWVLSNMPFGIYNLIENFLDIRRLILLYLGKSK